MRALPVLLLLLATPALSQEAPNRSVTTDLDGDGRPETFTLIESGTTTMDLMVDDGTGWATARELAWDGRMPGQRASLWLNAGGSVVIESGNDAIGRNRWHLLLTVAHRDGDLRVAGITYDWYDTLEPTAWGSCDLNLLSGRGVIETEAGTREVAVAGPAPALWDWRDTDPPVPFGDLCHEAR